MNDWIGLEIENQKKRDEEYNDLENRASHLDELLPGFFIHAGDFYIEYLRTEIEEPDNSFEEEKWQMPFFDYISDNWFDLLKSHYEEQLRTMPIGDVYHLNVFLEFFSCGEYMGLFKGIESFQEMAFLTLFDISSDDFDDYFGFEERDEEDYDLEEEVRYTFKEADDEFFDIPEEEGYIFHVKDNAASATLDDLYFDYYRKKNSLYLAITRPDISVKKRKKWAADFVSLTESVLKGNYIWGFETINVKDMETERPGTGMLNLNMLTGEVRSYRTCFLYFFNFIEQKTAKSFIEFVRFSYLTCVNIYDHHMTDEAVFDRSEPALLQYIYDYARRILEECKRENTYGICLNCLPKYTNTGLLSYVPKEKEYLFREYYADAITPFVDVLTNEDLGCCRLAVKLIAEGYDRKDLRDYVSHYHEREQELKKYAIIYNKIYGLAQIQQILYLVAEAISINNNLSQGVPNIKRLCNQIQDYAYQDYEFDRVEKELESKNRKSIEISSLSAENALYRKYMYLLNVELDSGKSYDELFAARKALINQIFNEGIRDETDELLTEINEKVLSYIEYQIEQEGAFGSVNEQVKKSLEQYVPSICEKIGQYLSEELVTVKDIFESIRRKLSTAELLYKRYVEPYSAITDKSDLPDEIQEMDYSFIALEYYTALEQLANTLLYYPYKEKILAPAFDRYGDRIFDNKDLGYAGGLERKFVIIKKGNKEELKASLELGTLSYLYDPFRGKPRKYFSKIEAYLKGMSLSLADARKFVKKLNDIRDLRNEAAHGGENLDIDRARKAQDVSYIHYPTRDQKCKIKIADECHAEIINLLKWFSNK